MAEDVAPFYAQARAVGELVDAGRLELVPWPRTTREQYARLLVSAGFWEQHVRGDRVLVFQADSVPCSGAAHNLTEFYGYDYIGAAWPDAAYGGNGGLSLRNRTALIQLLQQCARLVELKTRRPGWTAEDVLICLSPQIITAGRVEVMMVLLVVCVGQHGWEARAETSAWRQKRRAGGSAWRTCSTRRRGACTSRCPPSEEGGWRSCCARAPSSR